MAKRDAAYLELPQGTSHINWHGKPGLCLTVAGLKRLQKILNCLDETRPPARNAPLRGRRKALPGSI